MHNAPPLRLDLSLVGEPTPCFARIGLDTPNAQKRLSI